MTRNKLKEYIKLTDDLIHILIYVQLAFEKRLKSVTVKPKRRAK